MCYVRVYFFIVYVTNLFNKVWYLIYLFRVSDTLILIGCSNLSDYVSCTTIDNNKQLATLLSVRKTAEYCFDCYS